MSLKTFFISLLFINVLLGIGIWGFHSIIKYARYIDLSIIGLATLTIFNIIVYLLARQFSKKSNDKRYMHLIFINFLAKLIIVIGIPTIYYLVTNPQENYFIIPFVGIYLVFTIFETWYLNKSAIMRRG